MHGDNSKLLTPRSPAQPPPGAAAGGSLNGRCLHIAAGNRLSLGLMSSRSSSEANYCYSDYIISRGGRGGEQREREREARQRDRTRVCLWTRSRRRGEAKGGKDGERVYKFKEGRREGTQRIEEDEMVEQGAGEDTRERGRKREGLKRRRTQKGRERERKGGKGRRESETEIGRERERSNLKEWKHNSDGGL